MRPPEIRQKPQVGAFTSARLDKILALDPDLVPAFSDLQADIVSGLAKEGVAVHLFNQRDLAGIFAMIRTVGALIGEGAKAEALARMLEERVAVAAHERIVTSVAVIAAGPDVILASWCGNKVVPRQIAERAGRAGLPAVANKRIVGIKSTLVLRPALPR